MSLSDYILNEQGQTQVRDKVKISIERLQHFEPPEGYYLAFSGGKDSQCIYHLAMEAGVKFEAHYHITTVDPPELVWFIRDNYPDVIMDKPEITMWDLIVKKGMPPTMNQRYCCAALKEVRGKGRICVTGVRWAKSARRKKNRKALEIMTSKAKDKMLFEDNDSDRRLFETCIKQGKRIINPIVDWENADVWEFIRNRKLKYCVLYDNGSRRIGCIGCPMNSRAGAELEAYPKYKAAYLRAFQRMIDKHGYAETSDNWKTPEDVMAWWLYKGKKSSVMAGQVQLT